MCGVRGPACAPLSPKVWPVWWEDAAGGKSHRLPSRPPRTTSCRSMDLESSDLLDEFLEPPEDAFSAGSLPELGLTRSPPEVPGTRLGAPGRRGCWSVVGGGKEEVKHA